MALEILNEIHNVEKEETERLINKKSEINVFFNDEVKKIEGENLNKLEKLRNELENKKRDILEKYIEDNLEIINDSKNKIKIIDDLFNEKKEEVVEKILDFITRSK